jgi:hypothetical protein
VAKLAPGSGVTSGGPAAAAAAAAAGGAGGSGGGSGGAGGGRGDNDVLKVLCAACGLESGGWGDRGVGVEGGVVSLTDSSSVSCSMAEGSSCSESMV